MKKPVPYDFVLSELSDLNPYTKPMFGCTAVYVGDKIVFILRQKGDPLPDDGVWLATTGEHHESLKKDFPSMRSIELFGPGPTGWQVLPADADDFEDSVLKACEFVHQDDERIGKVPKSRWKKKSAGKKSPAKPPTISKAAGNQSIKKVAKQQATTKAARNQKTTKAPRNQTITKAAKKLTTPKAVGSSTPKAARILPVPKATKKHLSKNPPNKNPRMSSSKPVLKKKARKSK